MIWCASSQFSRKYFLEIIHLGFINLELIFSYINGLFFLYCKIPRIKLQLQTKVYRHPHTPPVFEDRKIIWVQPWYRAVSVSIGMWMTFVCLFFFQVDLLNFLFWVLQFFYADICKQAVTLCWQLRFCPCSYALCIFPCPASLTRASRVIHSKCDGGVDYYWLCGCSNILMF